MSDSGSGEVVKYAGSVVAVKEACSDIVVKDSRSCEVVKYTGSVVAVKEACSAVAVEIAGVGLLVDAVWSIWLLVLMV